MSRGSQKLSRGGAWHAGRTGSKTEPVPVSLSLTGCLPPGESALPSDLPVPHLSRGLSCCLPTLPLQPRKVFLLPVEQDQEPVGDQ